ncbi:hypothetical protein FMUND_94 [Fusarium mundagurra]|uniref:Uncharacterized protein n=1 Tax=Fusarium mundagurra TaxID=1567541 RepID=A0A8H6DPX0_9HYPO|nr:hypothetical protein FMUND_94 [Fusarium mundagurra]
MRRLKDLVQKLCFSNDSEHAGGRATRLITAQDGGKNDIAETLPPYRNADLDSSTLTSLKEVEACRDMGSDYGVADPFNAFTRRWVIYIGVQKQPTRDASISTKQHAEYLLNFGKAFGTDMCFHFPTISNEKHPELTHDALEKYKVLKELTYSKNFDDAMTKVRASDTLRHLGIEAVIKGFEHPTKNDQSDIYHDNNLPRYTKKSLSTTADRFRLFLHKIYRIMAQYMRGWDIDELTPEMLEDLINKAQHAAGEHTVFRDHQRVMYERMIALWESQRWAEDSHPTTAFYITESPMEASELRSLMSIMKQLPDIDGELETEVSEFVIQTLAWTDGMDSHHQKNFKSLDDSMKGSKKDIFDVALVSAREYRCCCGPSAKLWLKLLYGHLKVVDDKLKFVHEKDKYAAWDLGYERDFIVPKTDELKETFGISVQRPKIRSHNQPTVGNSGEGEQPAPLGNDRKGYGGQGRPAVP